MCGGGWGVEPRVGGGHQSPRRAGYQATSEALLYAGPRKESGWLVLGGLPLALGQPDYRKNLKGGNKKSQMGPVHCA